MRRARRRSLPCRLCVRWRRSHGITRRRWLGRIGRPPRQPVGMHPPQVSQRATGDLAQRRIAQKLQVCFQIGNPRLKILARRHRQSSARGPHIKRLPARRSNRIGVGRHPSVPMCGTLRGRARVGVSHASGRGTSHGSQIGSSRREPALRSAEGPAEASPPQIDHQDHPDLWRTAGQALGATRMLHFAAVFVPCRRPANLLQCWRLVRRTVFASPLLLPKSSSPRSSSCLPAGFALSPFRPTPGPSELRRRPSRIVE